MSRLKTVSSRQTNREFIRVKAILYDSKFNTLSLMTHEEVTDIIYLFLGWSSLSELEAGPTSASHLKSSGLCLSATHTLTPPRGITYWNVIVSSQGSTAQHSVSLNLYSTNGHPRRRRLPRNPPSMLIPFLSRWSNTFSAHPLSCVLSLATWRHPSALRWLI